MKSLYVLATELCWQIEKCGASEELTKASDMASELHNRIKELDKVLRECVGIKESFDDEDCCGGCDWS